MCKYEQIYYIFIQLLHFRSIKIAVSNNSIIIAPFIGSYLYIRLEHAEERICNFKIYKFNLWSKFNIRAMEQILWGYCRPFFHLQDNERCLKYMKCFTTSGKSEHTNYLFLIQFCVTAITVITFYLNYAIHSKCN